MLPDKPIVYLCQLCEPASREVFSCETLVKSHLASHGYFFLQRWDKFVEFKCKICESVIIKEDLEGHVNEFHSCKIFSSRMDNGMMDSKSPGSQVIEKSQSLPNSLPAVKKVNQWQASQPGTPQQDLWDQCFKPEHLINKYFGTLASKPKISQSQNSPPCVSEKPRIRVKPLSLLLAQSQSSPPPVSPPSTSQAQSSSPPPPAGNEISPEDPTMSGMGMGSMSPGSDIAKEVPQARTWLPNSDSDQCIICGVEVLKRMLPHHIQSLHQDMMFRCTVGSCRKDSEHSWSSFLYPNQLNRHHQVLHQLNHNKFLDLSENMTGLPSSLVRIFCSMCNVFMLGANTMVLGDHIRYVHGGVKAVLKFNCRLCKMKSSSVEDVIRHSMSHRSGGELVKDVEMSEQESDFTRNIDGQRMLKVSQYYLEERRKRYPKCRNQSPPPPHREMSSSESLSSRSSNSKDSGKRNKDSLGRKSKPSSIMRTPVQSSRRSPSGTGRPDRRECRSPLTRRFWNSPRRRKSKSPSNRKRMRSPSRSPSRSLSIKVGQRKEKSSESSESKTRVGKDKMTRRSPNRQSRSGTHRSRSSSRGSSRWGSRRTSPCTSSQSRPEKSSKSSTEQMRGFLNFLSN